MARPLTTLVVFFVAMNLFAAVFISTGVAAMIGLDANVGGDEAAERATQDTDLNTGTPLGSTLFGMYNVLAGQLSSFFNAIFPGLDMLNRAGVPGYITGGILGPLFSLAIFVDLISFMRGWGL